MNEIQYNECVNACADNVYRFILKNLRHKEDARDIVQSAFEKLWINHKEVVHEKSKSYLFKVAYHEMIDQLRRCKKTLLRQEFNEESRVFNRHANNLREILEEGLSRLSETKRSLVLLKDYEGYSYEEIGEITGLSASQVKVYLHRARMEMKEYLVKIENVI